MSSQLPAMKAAFEEAIQQVLFKGSAIDNIKRIAMETVETLEQELERVKKTMCAEIGHLETQQNTYKAALRKNQEALNQLQQKLEHVIEISNAGRKSAVARANRYKAKYECLLDDINQMLPGAKDLLTSKVIAQSEKIKKLQQLESVIAKQKKRVREKVAFDSNKLRDVYLPGYGKQRRILQSLLKRKQQLENKKSY